VRRPSLSLSQACFREEIETKGRVNSGCQGDGPTCQRARTCELPASGIGLEAEGAADLLKLRGAERLTKASKRARRFHSVGHASETNLAVAIVSPAASTTVSRAFAHASVFKGRYYRCLVLGKK
jgi:hypothetical protein